MITAYTYSIFDADPAIGGNTVWPSHDSVAFAAKSDDDARKRVRDIMSTEAASLNTSDGYNVGDHIWCRIWKDGVQIGRQSTYELTAEDLGVADCAEDESAQ